MHLVRNNMHIIIIWRFDSELAIMEGIVCVIIKANILFSYRQRDRLTDL